MMIYIAAPFEEQKTAEIIKNQLELKKIIVTSRWITMEKSKPEERTDEYLTEWAKLDLIDVYKADILMLLNPEKYRNMGTGGRHVEVGYALGLYKPVLVYGEKTNIFHWHPRVTYLSSPGDFIKTLQKIASDNQIT